MNWVSFLALTFVVWWTVIFATLPMGLRTQDDEENVTLGTTSSAPRGAHMRRVVVRTTVITAIIMASYYLVTAVFGYGIDDIPSWVPEFN